MIAGVLIVAFWALLIFLWGRPWLFMPNVRDEDFAHEPDDVIAHWLGMSA